MREEVTRTAWFLRSLLGRSRLIGPQARALVHPLVDGLEQDGPAPSLKSLGMTIVWLSRELMQLHAGQQSRPVLLLHRYPGTAHVAVLEQLGPLPVLAGTSSHPIGQDPTEALLNAVIDALAIAHLHPNEVAAIWPGAGPWSPASLHAVQNLCPQAQIGSSPERKPARPPTRPSSLNPHWPKEWSR